MGSGFCPILSQRERRDGARWAPPNGGGRPRAMLAPDASVGKYEKRNTLMQEYSSSKSIMDELYKIRKNYGIYMGKEMER